MCFKSVKTLGVLHDVMASTLFTAENVELLGLYTIYVIGNGGNFTLLLMVINREKSNCNRWSSNRH